MNRMLFAKLFAIAAVAATSATATSVTMRLYADDYGTLSVDGTLLGSYDNPSAAGLVTATVDLTPGWHSITMDYANRAGTNALILSWTFPGDSDPALVALTDLRSPDQTGSLIPGLRADYYASLGGAYLFTIYGEGPIAHGAFSFDQEFYETNPGLWAGVFGQSSNFGEHLTGEIFVPGGVPEPSTIALFSGGILLLWLCRKLLAATGAR